MESVNRAYKKDDSIVARKIAGEFILVPIRSTAEDVDSIYTLNEVAGRIYELIDGKRHMEEIKGIIVDEFNVSPEEAEKDVSEFLEQMEKTGAVRVV